MNGRGKPGKIWLIGAGPGDPDLLTVKALRIIQQAELILFDQLISQEIKALFPKSTPAFYVGKKKDMHSLSQGELNRLMVNQARQGKDVVRVKGGDPLVFGRGGEEALVAAEAGIAVEIVPGITAASGCTSAANIPLTHRGLAQGCTFITAHAEKSLDLHWPSLAHLNHTLVIYMGVTRAAFISSQLQNHGMAGDTPVAIIENGCRPNQREIVGHLNELATLVKSENINSPAVIVIGKVVQYKTQFEALVTPSISEVMNNATSHPALLTQELSSNCA